MPIRHQRRRTKGYKTPPGVVYVGRGSRWGNPFRIGALVLTNTGRAACHIDAELAVALYRNWLQAQLNHGDLDLSELRGRDLSCWCREGSPCHADLLLELANKEPTK